MLVAANFLQHATRLAEPSISDEERRKLALEVREAIEVVHSQDYGSFLHHFLPAFVKVLTNITRPQSENNDVHKTRSIILEVMSRLPHNDVLKNRFHQLLPLAMHVMQTDNEENSVTAIHIVFDLHKTFRPQLEAQVEPFLSFVRQLYSSLSSTVDTVLLSNSPPPQSILPASRSFKVITECPLVVMFVFQLYPRCIRPNIQALLPLMLKAIQIQIPSTKQEVLRKPAFKDFIAAQVKTVTFLVYLLKQAPSNLMNFDEAWIPQSVVQLLKACPGSAIAIRKELLVATRHMLSSPFRKGFFSGIDALLDERVIAGTGRASTDALRPLGYQFLAELIHGVRFELQLPQLHSIITMFSTNLHDSSFSFALQTNGVRLLLNLVEGILRRNDAKSPKPRSLLVRIMRTMVAKYVTIGEQVPKLIQGTEESLKRFKGISSARSISTQIVGDPLKEVKDCKHLLKTLTLGLKTVVWSVINVKVTLKAPPQVPGLPEKAKPRSETQQSSRPTTRNDAENKAMVLLEEETEVLTRLLPASRKCFKLFTVSELQYSASSPDHPNSLSTEKEIFDQFAQIFTILDVRSFQDIFGLRMDSLLDYIVENPNALLIAQHFLSNQNVAKYFADILLGYVVEKLPSLGVSRPKDSNELTLAQKQCNALLSLFKSLFFSISTSLEQVLRLHITPIVRKCVNLALQCEDPHFYLQLLRSLFKSITGGKKHDVQFEALFRDFMPLVELVLSGLTALCHGPHRLVHKDVIVELCLLVPARPATLFPFLHVQIKPILWALNGSKENVQYGLRALDFWLEILQPSYIDTLMAEVEPEVTRALLNHLRFPERFSEGEKNSFGTAALRILGKLGGRSRRLALDPAPFEIQHHPAAVLQYRLNWVGVNDSVFLLSVDRILDRAMQVVTDGLPEITTAQKRAAWEFCRTCLLPYFGLQEDDDFLYSRKQTATEEGSLMLSLTSSSNKFSGFRLQVPETESLPKHGIQREVKTKVYRCAEMDRLRSLLTTMLISSSMSRFPCLSGGNVSPSDFAYDLCKYFAIMSMNLSSNGKNTFETGDNSLGKEHSSVSAEVIDPNVFLDALVEVACLEHEHHREAGLNCLKHFLSHVIRLQEEQDRVYSVPNAIRYILVQLCKFCYRRKWNLRIASVHGLRLVLEQLPSKFFEAEGIKTIETRIVKALLAVSAGPPNFSGAPCSEWARTALTQLLNRCHGQQSESDEPDQEIVQDVINSIAIKIASRSAGTRLMAKEALARLSVHFKKPVCDLVQVKKERLFEPLRKRSIRQFQVCDQIGFLDAVTYFIGLRDKSFAAELFSDPFKSTIVLGALSILDDSTYEKLTESEEGVRSKVVESKNPQTGLVVKLTQLRFRAVELLSSVALHCAEHVGRQGNDEIFRRMITVFFKCLQSRDNKIVSVAKVGLKEAISTNKNPKETLQNNLRPILSNLADYKKLTLPYLDGLSRILELLSHWFNVNLGDKLLEHLSHWTEPQKMAMHTRRHPGTEAKIAASILDLFHLLPAAAHKFMDSIVYMVLRLEFEQGVAGPGVGRLGLKGKDMASISPFREPLLKFCNKHPACAVKFFLSRLNEVHVRHLFFVLLRADNAKQLRSKLRSEGEALLACTFNCGKTTQESMANAFYGVVVIDAILLDASTNWLAENPKILAAVVTHWNHRGKQYGILPKPDRGDSSDEIDEYFVMARVLMRFCKENLPANNVLFSLLWVFGLRMECDFSFVKRFLHETVTESIDVSMKNSVLCHFLDCFASNEYSQEWKVNALQMIVIPMLKEHLRLLGKKDSHCAHASSPYKATSVDCSLPQDFSDIVLSTSSVSRVVKELFDRPDEVLRTYDETLSAELLQLSTLLIQYLPAQVGTYRKELIKFGWAHLKREESVAKHWAFVNVSRFFQAYQAPPKIILQVYVALLRAVQSESKCLVKLALDVLTPALPRRLEHNPNDMKCPIWIRYTKKVLLEEGHSVVNLVHIWQLIIRHSELFFVARAQFVPIMVTSLARIGNQSNNSAEYRRVALDLAKLIISWRKEDDASSKSSISPPPSKKMRLEDSSGNIVSNSKTTGDEFQPNMQMLSATVGFLSQLPFRSMDRRERNLVSKRSVALVDSALANATSVDFSAIIFDKLFDMTEKSHEQSVRVKSTSAGTNLNNGLVSSDARSNGPQKSSQARGDKNEALRNDVAFHRAAVLKTGLELCIVFTKQHCVSFTQTKASVLVSLVSPVLTGKDALAARLLGKLATNFIKAFPNWGRDEKETQIPANNQSAGGKMEPVMQPFVTAILGGIEESLRSDCIDVNYNGLVVLKDILELKPHVFLRFRDLLTRLFQRLVKDAVQPPSGTPAVKNENVESSGRGSDSASTGKKVGGAVDVITRNASNVPRVAIEGQCKTLCLSILGENIVFLEATHRKTFIQCLYVLIERCNTVEVLLEIVRVVSDWVTWRQKSLAGEKTVSRSKPQASKEPLALKEKVQLLLKMILFERVSGNDSQKLMNSYLEVILTVFGSKGCTDRRPELLPKLERAFLTGLNCRDRVMRTRFFLLFDSSLTRNPLSRLHYIMSRQDWSHLVEAYWIKHAVGLLIQTVELNSSLLLPHIAARFPRILKVGCSASLKDVPNVSNEATEDYTFLGSSRKVRCESFVTILQELVINDDELAYLTWIEVFPRVWDLCSAAERSSLESSFTNLLLKEYHIFQCQWPRNVVQALLDGAFKARPRLTVPPELLLHLASRWNVWFTVVAWLRLDVEVYRKEEGEHSNFRALEHVFARIFDILGERDHFAGLVKHCTSPSIREAITLEQMGREDEAQMLYAQVMQQYQATYLAPLAMHGSNREVAHREVVLCESRWVHCAKQLCQWEVLTEFARSVVQSDLLHECLWRAPDWSAMKELLYRHPVEDGPTLRLYQAYIHLQENKLESADSSITNGFKKSVEKFCALPNTAGHNCLSEVLSQFQQLVELEESSRILQELNALSRLGSVNVNVEQKIDAVKNILCGWRERLPLQHESLSIWNSVLSWRNHVHAVVVNVLETLKDTANAKVLAAQTQNDQNQVNGRNVTSASAVPPPTSADVQAAYAIAQSLPQHVLVIGVNETAWNIHRFARACRKQGQPNVAIHALLKLYPFGTMELSEYFVKTMESAKSFLLGPHGLENNINYGLNELNRCNMDHFNPRQKAQLFAMKGKFYKKLGLDEQSVDAFSIALSLSNEVSAGWLGWAMHCDEMHTNSSSFIEKSRWRVSAVNLYAQSIRCGSRKARRLVARLLRLISYDESEHRVLRCGNVPNGQSITPNALLSALSGLLDTLPVWIWIPWLPQLVSMFRCSSDTSFPRAVLLRVSRSFPQSTFFLFRSFFAERLRLDEPVISLLRETEKKLFEFPAIRLPSEENLAKQIQVANESLKRLQQRHQLGIARMKQLEGDQANANAYAKVCEEVKQLPVAITKVTEGIRALQQRHSHFNSRVKEDSLSAPNKSSNTVLGSASSENASNVEPGKSSAFGHVDWLLAHFARSNRVLYLELNRFSKELDRTMNPSVLEHAASLLRSMLSSALESNDFSGIKQLISLELNSWFGTLRTVSSPWNMAENVSNLVSAFELELKKFSHTAVPDQFVMFLRKWRNIFERRLHDAASTLDLESSSDYLESLLESDIEVFGQYNLSEATEIRSDSMVKISAFEAVVKVVHAHHGSARRIEILGNNGAKYVFVIESGLDQSSIERENFTSQLVGLIDTSVFGRFAHSVRRQMTVGAPRFIPLGHGSRISTLDLTRGTLAWAYEVILEQQGLFFDDMVMEFRNHLASSTRSVAFREVLLKTPDSLLLEFLAGSIPNSSDLFMFRKKFAESLGTNALVNSVLGVGDKRLENISVSWSTGILTYLNTRPEFNSRGTLTKGEPTLSRFTPNVLHVLGSIGCDGPLLGTVLVAFQALRKHRELLKHYLEVVLHNQFEHLILRWPVEQESKYRSLRTSTLSCLRSSRMSVIVETMWKRAICPTESRKLLTHAETLLRRSMKFDDLPNMHSCYQAWF